MNNSHFRRLIKIITLGICIVVVPSIIGSVFPPLNSDAKSELFLYVWGFGLAWTLVLVIVAVSIAAMALYVKHGYLGFKPKDK